MKHLLLILGLVCLGSSASTANSSTASFWQTIFPDAFSVVPVNSDFSNTGINTAAASNCSVPCVVADSIELLKLFTTDNTGPLTALNWDPNLGGNPVCTWGGIVIDAEGYVTEINLGGSNLTGSLPNTFGENGLTRIQVLKFSTNNLSGTIPSGILNLTTLSTLWLDDNEFTGTLPAALGDLQNLSFFWVDNNKFTGAIPQSLLTVASLANLSIFNNCFDSLPDFTGSASPNIKNVNADNIRPNNNKFTFDDLVPNADFLDVYSTQATFNIPAVANVQTGETYAIDLGIDAGLTTNRYKWTKNSVPFGPTLSVNKLDLSPITFADAGTYCCTVTNTVLTDLTLVSTCQEIRVTCGTSTETINDVLCAGDFINVNGTNYGDGFDLTGIEDVPEPDQYGCDSMVMIDLTIMNGVPVDFEPTICPDDTIFVNGNPYYFGNNAGREPFMVSGCDSIVDVNVSFFPVASNTIDGTYCRSDTVYVDGVAYYFGNATDNRTLFNDSFRGCDSLITINMDFYPEYEGEDKRVLCSGQSVFINGTEYGAAPFPQSGLERVTGVAPNGCDSLVSVQITISNGVTVERNDVLCLGQSIFVNNNEYGESPLPRMGTEEMTLSNGCDSTVNINLSFKSQITDNYAPFFCYDQTIEINGTTYGNPALGHKQNGTETIPGANGCDTLRSIFINIQPASEADTSFVICEGGSVFFNGNFYNEGKLDGVEVIENADPNGCDSTYNVTVTVYIPEETNLNPEVCPGRDYVLVGRIFDAADPSGSVVLEGFYGCDSTVNVAISFYDSLKGNFTRTICDNDNFTYNGTLYGDDGSDGGMEVISGAGANGCDSFIQVTVNYFPTTTGNYTLRLCPGESEIFDNTRYGSQDGGVDSGFETLEGEGFGDCDSTVNVTVFYYPDPSPSFYEERICRTDTLFYNGTAYHLNNINGIENIGNLSFNGCDSLVEVNVRFFPQVLHREDPTLCSGTTIFVNGTTYGEAPTYLEYDSIVLKNASYRGCDSIIVVDLNFNSFVENNIGGDYCGCEEVIISGQTFDCNNPSDAITFPGGSYTGCDSIINIDLTYNEAPVFELMETLCPGTTINVRGTVYGENLRTGTEVFPATTSAGCDSTVNINLDFYPVETRGISATICQGDSILVGDTYYKFAGTFNEIVPMATANNCDSILVLNLTVTEPEPVELDDLGEICDSANPIALPTVQADVNGNWTGDGVTGNMFDPAMLTDEIILTFTPTNGCAEANSTNIIISSFSSGMVTDSICPGQMLNISGIEITMPGSYRDTLEGATITGCDSLVLIEISPKTPVAITLENISALCAGDAAITLNTTQDGVAGSWSGDGTSGGNTFDPAGLIGNITLTFTPTEMGCFAPTTTEVNVNDGGPVTLENLPAICSMDNPIILNTTQSGTSGTWTGDGVIGDTFDPSMLTGNIELTFTPTSGGCVAANSTFIEITAPQPVPLQPLGMICGNNTVALSTTNSDGVSGIWSGPGISPSGNEFNPTGLASGDVTLTFTPNGDDCVTENTTTITIGDFASESVSESVCEATGQTVTINEEIYASAGIYADTIVGGSVAGCDSIINITITDATIQITLDVLPGLCNSGGIFNLPTIQSGVMGSWTGTGVTSGNAFDPTGLNGSFTLDFIPDAGACAMNASTSIEVGNNAIGTMTATICEGDSVALSSSFYFTTGTYMDTIPNGSVAGCDSISTLTLTVENTTYNLDNFSALCTGADPIDLPTLQDGINGIWEGNGINTNTFDPNGLFGNVSITFVPEATSCAEATATTIEVTENIVTNLEATICEGEVYPLNNTDYSTAGTYMQTLSGAGADCDTILNFILNVESVENLPAANAGNDQEICGDETSLAAVTSNGITGFWEALIGAPMITDETNPTANISDLQDETYQLSWVVSSEFCPDYDQDTVNISIAMDEPLAVVDSLVVTNANPTEFDLIANDELPENFIITLLNEPTEGTIENLGNGIYQYTAASDFESGQLILGYQVCSEMCPDLCSQAAIIIDLEKNNRPVVEVPSGITPNGDDKNERLVIPAIRDNPELFDRAELVIFNRWGDMIFQAKPYTNNWDGSGSNGKIVPQGTYYYVLRLNLGEGMIYKGDITVLR